MNILYEDDDLLVINKPAGMVVNRAETTVELTVQDWLTDYLKGKKPSNNEDLLLLLPLNFDSSYGTPEEIFQSRGGIVHRLDKDTSGALVLAKNPGALVNLLAQFKQRQTEKTYTCLVHGKLKLDQGTISAPLGRASTDRKKFAVVAEGRVAETEYRVEEFYPHLDVDAIVRSIKRAQGDEAFKNFKKKAKVYQGFSLVTCWPKTGRTHQIRVHFKHLGHPLVGDTTYLGHKRAKLDPVWCSRQFLHASSLVFTHPRTGERLAVEAPLAEDLEKVMNYLRAK